MTFWRHLTTDYINFRDSPFDAQEDALLRMAPKFILNEPNNVKDTIAKIETAFGTFPEDIKDKVRIRASEVGRLLKSPRNLIGTQKTEHV